MAFTINSTLQEGIQRLLKHNKTDATIDARLLLSSIIPYDRVGLILHGNDIIEEKSYLQYMDLIEQRVQGRPLQHILGDQEFMGLLFKVNEHTLIPRRETEELVELVMTEIQDTSQLLIMDIGTGSGCIPISLAVFKKNIKCIGIDCSEDALKVAKTNSALNQVEERITWILSDVFENVSKDHQCDVLISNPPYIKTEAIPELMTEVKDYEPYIALDGGEDGLNFYRKICSEGKAYLKEGGQIFFEIGFDQKDAVISILKENEYKNIRYKKDLSGQDRMVYAQK